MSGHTVKIGCLADVAWGQGSSIKLIRLFGRHFDNAGIAGRPVIADFFVELSTVFCPDPDVFFFKPRINGDRDILAFCSG